MTWATSTTALGSESSSLGAALLPKTAPSPALAPVPGALWRDGDVWDGSSIVVVEPQGMRAVGTAAAARGYLWVPVTAPRVAQRGRLALHIEECIESALEQRGAPPPGVGASTHLDASLSDQLYRARFVEMRGIAVGIPSLEGIANLGRVLDAEDSAVLRWWLAATTDRPLCVVLSSENRALRVYPSPVPFGTVMEGIAPPTPRAPSVETAQSVVAMELSDLPPAVAEAADDEPTSLADGVELPDLDRALGLSPLLGPIETSQGADEPDFDAAEPASSVDVAVADVAAAPVEPSEQCAALDSAPCVAEEPAVAAPHAGGHVDLRSEPAQSVEAVEAVEARAPETTEPAVNDSVDAPRALDVPTAEALAPLPIKTLVSPRLLAQKSAERAKAKAEALADEGQTDADALPPMQLDDEPEADGEASSSPVVATSALPAPLPRKRTPFMIMAAEPSDEADAAPAAEAPEASPPAATEAKPSGVALPPIFAERRPLRSQLRPLRPRMDPPPSRAELSLEAAAPAAEPVEPHTIEAAESSEAAASAASAASVAREPSPDPFDAFARDNWRTWVKELEAARGPKPLAVIERLFVTAYMRLDAALERKIADESAREVMVAWRDSFAKSYTEAFDALRVRGKRPTMVLDIPDLAQRMGRLHGARRVQLLLVDGLRFDLGMMIQDRLKSRGDATLAERLLLWSALPANTATQVELIGRGPDGLKDKDMPVETPAVVARGRAAHALRRIRTGRRELFKLDIVEASLREGEGNVRDRLHTIADDVTASISDHFSKQPPRTLVMVFGDHGFRIEDESKVSQGGATPEEVLVPAFAWLTGAMH